MPLPKSRETIGPGSISRRFPIGAELVPGGGVHFRVWAPKSKEVAVEFQSEDGDAGVRPVALGAEGGGYFSGWASEAKPGMRYKLRLDSGSFPDPASRFQPLGPHGPSEIVDPGAYPWRDTGWKGVQKEGAVLYEMHIGTFTREGTWKAAAEQLPELARCGVTILEVMPVAAFPGRFGWGYDGVDLFAPTQLYGAPDDFRAFVDEAHGLGLGVILDVVYNHLGPDGNFLKEFSPDYFTDRYKNEWGEAINFDENDSGPVREFFLANAVYWISEYHLDGLRLDATQQIFDRSRPHILEEIARAVREAALGRGTFTVGENEPQNSMLIRPVESGGYGMDALWNDDFHHTARVALTGHKQAYYSDYEGSPQEFVSALKWGFLYQGQYYSWQKKGRGKPVFGLHPAQLVTFLQNHDQVANSLSGKRIHELTAPGLYRAMTALLLLGPSTPMLFQGQEFAASAPFLFFADHHPELAALVEKGRRDFLEQFPSIAVNEVRDLLPQPHAEEAFERCKLDFSERESHGAAYALHKDLLELRRTDPVFGRPRIGGLDGAVIGKEAFVLRFFGGEHGDRLLVVNLGIDFIFTPMPEPLLGPPENGVWRVRWSTEHPRYGGCGMPPMDVQENWKVPGRTAVVLVSESNQEENHG